MLIYGDNMKLYLTAKNEKGKTEGIGGNEALTIEINRGNRRMVEFYLTIEKIDNNSNGLNELVVLDMLNLSDGSTTRVYEHEINSNLPEHKANKCQHKITHVDMDAKGCPVICWSCGEEIETAKKQKGDTITLNSPQYKKLRKEDEGNW
jgi:hypothetical protein